jgi:hypothetical protein
MECLKIIAHFLQILTKNFFNIKDFNFKADLFFHKTRKKDKIDVNYKSKINKDSPAAITTA